MHDPQGKVGDGKISDGQQDNVYGLGACFQANYDFQTGKSHYSPLELTDPYVVAAKSECLMILNPWLLDPLLKRALQQLLICKQCSTYRLKTLRTSRCIGILEKLTLKR